MSLSVCCSIWRMRVAFVEVFGVLGKPYLLISRGHLQSQTPWKRLDLHLRGNHCRVHLFRKTVSFKAGSSKTIIISHFKRTVEAHLALPTLLHWFHTATNSWKHRYYHSELHMTKKNQFRKDKKDVKELNGLHNWKVQDNKDGFRCVLMQRLVVTKTSLDLGLTYILSWKQDASSIFTLTSSNLKSKGQGTCLCLNTPNWKFYSLALIALPAHPSINYCDQENARIQCAIRLGP